MASRSARLCLAYLAGIAFASSAAADCDSARATRTPTSRYVIESGEVYDRKTDLTWQRCSLGQQWKDDIGCVGVVQQTSWQDAVAQANEKWRLPSRDELATLISPTCRNPAINEEAFPDLDLAKLWYWTSSGNGEYLAWLANFSDGSFSSYDRTDVGAVRLVRSGQ